MISMTLKNLKWTLVSITLFAALLVLTGCGSQPETQAPPAGTASGFEFSVNPQTGQVTLAETTGETVVQPQADPSDSRILTPNVEIGVRNLSFTFERPGKLIVYFQLKNLTTDLNFAQPFFFTLSSESKNLERAVAPLVTNTQLSTDGVLNPGETSQRFRFEAYFKGNEPFTFLVDTSAVVPNETSAVCTDPYTIPDQNLEFAIRGQLGKPSGYLSCADLESLTSLRADSRGISNLEGLQYAVNLTFLELGENILSDLAPLQNLTNLKQLFLYKNDVTDISALVNNGGLGSGDSVSLRKNPLSPRALNDVETLRARGVDVDLGSGGTGSTCTNPVVIPDKELKRLIGVALSKNSSDLTCADLKLLTRLIALSSSIANLEGLQYAVNLTYLRLEENDISDLTPLQNLTELTTLVLSDNLISDITPLQNLTKLTDFYFYGNTVSDITSLQNLTNLTLLDLSGNSISDITPLQNLTNLTTLYLGGNNISGFTPLQNLIGLETLYLDGNSVSDLAPLRNLTNLTTLGLDETTTSDLIPLQNFTSLTVLSLARNSISDLTPLQSLTNLSNLYLHENDISNLAPLQNLIRLEELNLNVNSVSDLSPLQNLANMSRLSLNENDISDITPLKDLTNMSSLDLSENDVSNISALVSGSVLDFGDIVYLYNNPLSPQALDDVKTLRDRGVDVFLEL